MIKSVMFLGGVIVGALLVIAVWEVQKEAWRRMDLSYPIVESADCRAELTKLKKELAQAEEDSRAAHEALYELRNTMTAQGAFKP